MLGVLAAMLGVIARVQVNHGQASNGDVAITGVVLGVLAIVASLIVAMFCVVPQMRITSIATSSALVVATQQAPACGQQLELGVSGYQTFGLVENVNDVAAVTGQHGHADARPTVQIA
jgi:hypothetical protein